MRNGRAAYRAVALWAVGLLALTGCVSWTPPALDITLDTRRSESTHILAADGSTLAVLHAVENREPVTLDRVPVVMRQALLDIEDPAFYEHKGVDYRALIRSVWNNVRAGAAVEGGSTITQQYLKNTTSAGAPRNLREKIREANLAVQLEKRFTKDQVLEAYLNTVYFGRGAYGIQAAAKTWFGKDVSELTIDEAPFLAGLVQAPSVYEPEVNGEATRERRDRVIDQMVRHGHLESGPAQQLKDRAIAVRPRFENERFAAAYFVDHVARFIATDPSFGDSEAARADALYSGGLRVHTTLDPAAQRAAEEAVGRVLSDPADPYAALVAIEPATGAVKAMVGGRDYFSASDPVAKFNLATQARRSSGSSFKTFVLAAALASGIRPTTVIEAPATLDIPDGPNAVWHVENYEGRATGNVNLVEATVRSVNTAYANLITQLGPHRVLELAHQMGITSDIPEVPSIALGSARVSAFEMATAYATLANQGRRVFPVTVTKVTDREGRIVWEPERKDHQVLPPDVANLETAILTQVVDRGTGVGARLGRPAAGKTGTGQDHRDAWFVGYTPDLATAVWVGFPQAEIPMVPPTTRTTVLGGTYPASIFQLFMSQALAATPVSQFPPAPAFSEGASAGSLASYVGQPYEEALRSLQRRGFKVAVEYRFSGDYPPGRVIGHEPGPGQNVEAGGTVTLFVATTQGRPVTLPHVLGMDSGSAQERLRVSGVTVEVVTEAEEDPAAARTRSGRVWKQDPAGGTGVPPGTAVTIYANP